MLTASVSWSTDALCEMQILTDEMWPSSFPCELLDSDWFLTARMMLPYF